MAFTLALPLSGGSLDVSGLEQETKNKKLET